MSPQITLAAAPNSTQGPSPAAMPMMQLDLDRIFPEVGGSIRSVREEIDDAFEDLKSCVNRQPDEIMRLAGGHSARLSEIRVRIQRIEDVHRQWRAVRTREVEPALEALQFQFTVASRLHSVRELDFKMESVGT